MPAESKKLDTKCLEPFGGEIWGLSFAVSHSDICSNPKCSSQKMYTFFGFYSIDSGDVNFFLA